MFFRQLGLLLWKNVIIRRRQSIRTIIEILWPLFLFAILVAIRKTRPIVIQSECHYPARALPSAGVFPWLQTLMCNLQNPCFSVPVDSEYPGQVNSPKQDSRGLIGGVGHVLNVIRDNTTLLDDPDKLVYEIRVLEAAANVLLSEDSDIKVPISMLLKNPTLVKTNLVTIVPVAFVDTLLSSEVNLAQASYLSLTQTPHQQRDLACNVERLKAALTVSSGPYTPSEMVNVLCPLNDTSLNFVFMQISDGIDIQNFINKQKDFAKFLEQISSEADVNLSDLVFILTSWLKKLPQLELVGKSVSELMSSLSESSTQGNMLESVLGYDLSTPDGMKDFCGHPQVLNMSFINMSNADFLGNVTDIITDHLDNITGKRPEERNATAMCAKVIEHFDNNNSTTFAVFWKVMKPVLLGKIPFSPDTELTRLIIARANATFMSIAQWEELGEEWEDKYSQQVYDYMEKSAVVNELRAMLSSDIDLSLLGINLTRSDIESLQAFLSNDKSNPRSWKNTFTSVDTAIRLITDMLKCVNLDKFVGYPDENEMVNASLSLIKNNTFWAGIQFDSPNSLDTEMPEHIQYKIRQDVDDVMRTDLIERFFWTVGSHSGALNLRYYINGFIDVKDMIDHGLIESVTMEINKTKPIVSSQPLALPKLGQYLNVMPYPCYMSDEFLEYMGSMMAITMVLSWVYSVCVITQKIVYEKEKRLKEIMKMMGLSNAVHWVAWFITSFTLMVISIILLIALLKLGDITPYSNVFILFIWLTSFAIATIAECFLISCFFSQANLAAACGGIIYFMLYIPYNFAVAWDNKLTFGGKIGLSLFSSVAFGYGSDIMSKYEMGGTGVQFSNWHKSPLVTDERQYTFVTSIVMMLVDATIYFIMTWYVENAFPGRYGVPRKWYFPFQKSYWTGKPEKDDKNSGDFSSNPTEALVESEPTHLTLGVSIKNLVKIYSDGNKLAVSNLSLNFYEDQITSFLGHNGAGKTTTMSILSGLFPATSGTATIYGHNIANDMDAIRQNLGFCPQHNVLFGSLTVEEHLRFFGGLKGLTDKEIKLQVNDMLHDINLVDKRDEISRNLSGGMKRKLSVAIAFVGNSKCIILDEPTAGVDPYARRGIWDMVINYKQGRTILLSTHHMDEADLLGDRIAIISQGQLKTCGSSLFLKSSLGVGYYITVVKDDLESSSQRSSEKIQRRLKMIDDEQAEKASLPSSSADSGNYSTETSCSSEEIAGIMKKIIPESELHEESTREVTYIIPYEAQQDGRYGHLFEALDAHYFTYGLTDTSLEEIFLSVAKHVDEEKEIKDSKCFSCCMKPKVHRHNSIRRSSVVAQNVATNRDPIQLLKINAIESALNNELPAHSTTATSTYEMADDTTSVTSNELLNHFQPKGSWQVTGSQLVAQQFGALFQKRFHHSKRNRKGFIAQILLPSIFVAIALAFTLMYPPGQGQPALELQPWLYGSTYTFFSNDDASNADASSVSDAFIAPPGIGTRCVTNYTMTYEQFTYPCVDIDNVWKYDNATKSLSQPIDSNQEEVCECGTPDNPLLMAVCKNGAGGEHTPLLTTDTTDWMYNMTNRNVADWMVKTTDRFVQERFGGLSIGEKYHTALDYTEVDKILDIVERLNKTSADTRQIFYIFLQNMWRTENAKVWFDNNGFHAMPIWQNVLNNAILRSNLPPSEPAKDYGITAYNHPLNYTENQVDQLAYQQIALDTSIAIVVVFAMSFVPASFVLFLIDERTSRAKQMQFISGVNKSVYWISSFLWDLVNYTIPAFVVVIIFLCFQTDSYVGPNNLPCLICLLLLYGWAVTPMMYPFSFLFDVPSTAYVVLTCLNMFIGINTSIATFILQAQGVSLEEISTKSTVLGQDDENLYSVSNILKKVFLIFPQYCLGRGLIDMSINQATADAYERFGVDTFVSPFSLSLTGWNLIAMLIQGCFFFILTLLIQYNFFYNPQVRAVDPLLPINDEEEDEDVVKETERVSSSHDNTDDVIKIDKLSKVYKKFTQKSGFLAVDRISVGVPNGECFGLLGVNGAGKTTTFKMLTGDIAPSGGDASIYGRSIVTDIRSAQQNIGYCPQFDAINSLLTAREHLELYAKLRGVPPDEVSMVAEWGISQLGLHVYADRPAGTYSGGNKRKLSAAMAFIGAPPVVLLDEPTAGMDPRARRFLWKRITEAVRGRGEGEERCIVLTSHSMEECEALCSRLAIMVNGRLKCIGSSQHLKNKFGKGYTLSIKLKVTDFTALTAFIKSWFIDASIKEQHYNMISYQLPNDNLKLSKVFELLHTNKEQLMIEDYSVSQTSLDEVFVQFAKKQKHADTSLITTVTGQGNTVFEMTNTTPATPTV